MERKSSTFDPILIVYQIICLQAFYYLVMGTLLGMSHAVFDIQVSLDHFFNPEFVTFSTWNGWTIILCTLLGALGGYVWYDRVIVPLDLWMAFVGRTYCRLWSKNPRNVWTSHSHCTSYTSSFVDSTHRYLYTAVWWSHWAEVEWFSFVCHVCTAGIPPRVGVVVNSGAILGVDGVVGRIYLFQGGTGRHSTL